MTLQQIAQTLRNQASSSGIVTIDDTLLGSGSAFGDLVKSSLLRTQGNVLLNAKAADIPDPAGNSLSFPAGIPAQGSDSFLNLANQTVTATISQVGSVFQAELEIGLTQKYGGGNLTWVFSTSFPNLIGWPFDAIPFSSPVFILVFAPAQPPAGLSAGLNFQSAFGLTNILAAVNDLLATLEKSPQLQPMKGLIAQSPYGPVFSLEGSLGVPTLDLTALQVGSPYVGLSMNYGRPAGSTDPFQPYGLMYVGAIANLADAADQTVSLKTIFQLPLVDESPMLSLVIVPATDTSTSLNNIGRWMAGKSWDEFFAQEPAKQLLPFLQTFGLRSYGVQFSLGKFSILSTSLSVGTLKPWHPIPGNKNLVVSDFYVNWTLLDPFGAADSSVAISATLDMFGASGGDKITFAGAILIPQLQLSLVLQSGPNLTAAAWVEKIVTSFGGPSPDPWFSNALSGFTLNLMVFTLDVTAETMTYQLAGGFTVGEKPVDFDLFVDLGLQPFTYDVSIAFLFSTVSITGEITNADNKTQIKAGWSDAANPLDLNNIAISLGYDSLGIPSELDLGLRAIDVAYDITDSIFFAGADSANYGKADVVVFKPDPPSPASVVFFGGVNVEKPIDLTNLPLVGQALSALERVEIRDLKVQVASSVITEAEAKKLKTIVGNYPAVPDQGMASTVNASFVISLGTYTIPIGIGMGGESATGMPPEKSSVEGKPGGDTSGAVPSTPGAKSDGVTWFNVQKSVGPLTFKRLGVKYQESVLWFVLDTSFSAGGLTIDLLGAGVGSPLRTFSPQFTLDGLGLDFRSASLEIGGAFYKVHPGPGIDWEYAGGAVIRATKFSLSAIGDYASMSGVPSMFIFAQATGAFGGPPVFFVTGLAGGFGYNSSLRVPAVSEIYQFPLVAGAQDPSKIGGKGASPTQVIDVLIKGLDGKTPWISHQIGQYWFAVGIQFTSFQVVASNAMLLVQFGKRLLMALLGLSRARLPLTGTVTYANVELQLEIVFDPEEGVFSLLALLSPNSYLLDPACRLTGGFAFFMWFPPSQHPYDFVITLGGYHPSFDPAPWYPEVPRVGFSWSLDSTVSITGAAYFALTPAAGMAGGELSVTYQQGNLKAWFRAWANMLIYWNPFHFRVDMGVAIGASYRLDLGFTTTTLEVELGASLALWGPPTGGRATVHWFIISFTVNFGETETLTPPPLLWLDFQKQLPKPAEMIRIVPGAGLAANGGTDLSAGEPWSVRPAGFLFSVTAFVPNSKLQVVTSSSQGTSLLKSGDLLNIRPMQQTKLTAELTIDVTQIINGKPEPQLGSWTVAAGTQNVPKALWGTGPQTQLDQGEDQLVMDQLTGFNVTAPVPTLNGALGPIDITRNLKYTVLSQGTIPIRTGESPQGPVAVQGDTITIIQQQIADTTHTQARNDLFNALVALGVNPATNDDMTAFAKLAGENFSDSPLIVPASK
ncbi:MAG TPA: DUF6603 domain-containing protein [Silvibacterium sp.]|nr:DUF6603 domain-containing protein [Silvibacterium sp.]